MDGEQRGERFRATVLSLFKSRLISLFQYGFSTRCFFSLFPTFEAKNISQEAEGTAVVTLKMY